MKEVLSLISVAILGIGFVLFMTLLWFANIAAWVIGWQSICAGLVYPPSGRPEFSNPVNT